MLRDFGLLPWATGDVDGSRRGLLNVVCRVIGVLSDLGVCCRRLAVAGVGSLEVVLLLGLIFDQNRWGSTQ